MHPSFFAMFTEIFYTHGLHRLPPTPTKSLKFRLWFLPLYWISSYEDHMTTFAPNPKIASSTINHSIFLRFYFLFLFMYRFLDLGLFLRFFAWPCTAYYPLHSCRGLLLYTVLYSQSRSQSYTKPWYFIPHSSQMLGKCVVISSLNSLHSLSPILSTDLPPHLPNQQ